jgi:hypothetical protein
MEKIPIIIAINNSAVRTVTMKNLLYLPKR